MRAMALLGDDSRLTQVERPDPAPGPGEVALKVSACGVCRTDLHIADGDLPRLRPGIVPGHEIVGTVAALGAGVTALRLGERVGVPWLGGVCGVCPYCAEGAENLCDAPVFTGWTRDGGYAEACTADARFCVKLPEALEDAVAAPLLCAGLIGFRAWRMAAAARPVKRLGLYGFGAAAHLLTQLAVHEGQRVHAFTKPGDAAGQTFARRLGCVWAGGADEMPPEMLDAAILFAPAGELVPRALKAVRKGGTVVCGGIHMSDIPSFPYADLWGERRIVSVANLTREDAALYLPRAAAAGVRPTVTRYALADANRALADLSDGRIEGAGVLVMS